MNMQLSICSSNLTKLKDESEIYYLISFSLILHIQYINKSYQVFLMLTHPFVQQ